MTSRKIQFHPVRSGLTALALLALMGLGGAARADDYDPLANPNGLRLGMYFVHYNASAADLQGPLTPPGINLQVQNVNTPYAAYTRTLTNHWVVELAAGIPPTTHTVGKGPARLGSVPFNGEPVATVKWFSPSLVLNYVAFEPSARLRPYAGLGFNYTHFYDRRSTAQGNAANGGPTQTFLSDSVSPTATVGATYRITDRFSAYLSYTWATVGSQYNSNTAGVSRSTWIDFNPRTIVASIGYAF